MVPPSKYNTITAIASSLMSLGLMLGPILGGAINQTDQWRWVFYLKYVSHPLATLLVCSYPSYATRSYVCVSIL